jgi:hypothetical protein
MENAFFQWNVTSNVDLEDLSVDLMYEEGILLELTQEKGFNLLRIRFFYCYHSSNWEIPLEPLLKVLEVSKNRLWDFRKEGTPEDWKNLSPVKENRLTYIIENSFVKIFCDGQLMGCLKKAENGEFIISIYINPTKEQAENIPQWDVLYGEFVSTIQNAKLKL